MDDGIKYHGHAHTERWYCRPVRRVPEKKDDRHRLNDRSIQAIWSFMADPSDGIDNDDL